MTDGKITITTSAFEVLEVVLDFILKITNINLAMQHTVNMYTCIVQHAVKYSTTVHSTQCVRIK